MFIDASPDSLDSKQIIKTIKTGISYGITCLETYYPDWNQIWKIKQPISKYLDYKSRIFRTLNHFFLETQQLSRLSLRTDF